MNRFCTCNTYQIRTAVAHFSRLARSMKVLYITALVFILIIFSAAESDNLQGEETDADGMAQRKSVFDEKQNGDPQGGAVPETDLSQRIP